MQTILLWLVFSAQGESFKRRSLMKWTCVQNNVTMSRTKVYSLRDPFNRQTEGTVNHVDVESAQPVLRWLGGDDM